MKQELEAPEAVSNRVFIKGRLMGINWIDSKTESPVSVKVLETPGNGGEERKGGRLMLMRNFALMVFGKIMMFGLFGLYLLSCAGRAIGFRKKAPINWRKVSWLSNHMKLAVLFALPLAFAGCVGYVGPDYGPGYVEPAWGPDFYVFGGGYYHGHYAHAYSARGAASRGFAGHGGGHR